MPRPSPSRPEPPQPPAFLRLQSLAWLLDSAIRLPGGFRIGVDALIGLIPFLGDAVGVVLSGYVVREAARLGAPPTLLLRMAFNVAVEGIVGTVPFVGDIFDAAWKANVRNVRLLERHLQNPSASTRANRLFTAVILVVLFVFLALTAALSIRLMSWLWSQLSG